MSMRQQLTYILVVVGACCLIIGAVICVIVSGIVDKRQSTSEPLELCGEAILDNGIPQPIRLKSNPGSPIIIRSEKPMSIVINRCSEIENNGGGKKSNGK